MIRKGKFLLLVMTVILSLLLLSEFRDDYTTVSSDHQVSNSTIYKLKNYILRPSIAIQEKSEVEVESKQKIIQNDNKDNPPKPSLDIKEKVQVDSEQNIIQNDNKDNNPKPSLKHEEKVEVESKPKIIENEILTSTVDPEPVTETLVSESTARVIERPDVCPIIAPGLVGRLAIVQEPVKIEELGKEFPEVRPGGNHRPEECISRNKVAIVVPYRNRLENLGIFLKHLHPILIRQQLDYTIFIVEQADDDDFNRAKLFNVGFLEAIKVYNYSCIVFHDVDLLPEDDTNLYTCPEQPRHMSVAINIFDYKLPYPSIFGGVSAMSVEHFVKVNGFSNVYWGWGGEDDDMSSRVTGHGLTIARYSVDIARYTMAGHEQAKPAPERIDNLNRASSRFKTDGLNSCEYKILSTTYNQLYTNITVDLLRNKN